MIELICSRLDATRPLLDRLSVKDRRNICLVFGLCLVQSIVAYEKSLSRSSKVLLDPTVNFVSSAIDLIEEKVDLPDLSRLLKENLFDCSTLVSTLLDQLFSHLSSSKFDSIRLNEFDFDLAGSVDEFNSTWFRTKHFQRFEARKISSDLSCLKVDAEKRFIDLTVNLENLWHERSPASSLRLSSVNDQIQVLRDRLPPQLSVDPTRENDFIVRSFSDELDYFNRQLDFIRSDLDRLESVLPFVEFVSDDDRFLLDLASELEADRLPDRWIERESSFFGRRSSIVDFIQSQLNDKGSLLCANSR